MPTSQVQMLGVPLGSDAFVSEYVEGKLLANSVKVMSKLAAFEDPQAAMYLLRLSYGVVRANHFMRTTPMSQWSQVAGKFDQCVREAVAQILGTTFPGDSYEQACISTKVGGLGVRRVVDHAAGAFSASWHEASATCRESWVPVVGCSPVHQPQSVVSASVDRAALDGLISRAGKRDAQRLRRVDVPHANAWVSALPAAVDGKDCVMLLGCISLLYVVCWASLSSLLLPLVLFASKPWMF